MRSRRDPCVLRQPHSLIRWLLGDCLFLVTAWWDDAPWECCGHSDSAQQCCGCGELAVVLVEEGDAVNADIGNPRALKSRSLHEVAADRKASTKSLAADAGRRTPAHLQGVRNGPGQRVVSRIWGSKLHELPFEGRKVPAPWPRIHQPMLLGVGGTSACFRTVAGICPLLRQDGFRAFFTFSEWSVFHRPSIYVSPKIRNDIIKKHSALGRIKPCLKIRL